jgi:pimeloyl-ACP methyl ester carboxylesterase
MEWQLDQLISSLSGRVQRPSTEEGGAKPLIVAIHGGSYTSAYFDLPGRSLLETAATNFIPIVAIDRPGYGNSPPLPDPDMDIAGQAAFLVVALTEVWSRYGDGCSGIFLVGHSIGAAIAATIASRPGKLPLLGLAISGVGLNTTPGDHERWRSLPDTFYVDLPAAIKDIVMFGPVGSFAADMPAASRSADAPAVKTELLAITGWWHQAAVEILGRIAVPVHYRQAEFDRLWIVSDQEVRAFADALAASPLVDARIVPKVGHCMDFHHVGPALHLQQLGFALECALRNC